MSGTSYPTYCPNCENEDAYGYTDWKPFDVTNIECLECGFYTTTTIGQYDLEELNEQRKDLEVGEPLDKLPPFDHLESI